MREVGDWVQHKGILAVVLEAPGDLTIQRILTCDGSKSVLTAELEDMTPAQARTVDIYLHVQAMGLNDELVSWLEAAYPRPTE